MRTCTHTRAHTHTCAYTRRRAHTRAHAHIHAQHLKCKQINDTANANQGLITGAGACSALECSCLNLLLELLHLCGSGRLPDGDGFCFWFDFGSFLSSVMACWLIYENQQWYINLKRFATNLKTSGHSLMVTTSLSYVGFEHRKTHCFVIVSHFLSPKEFIVSFLPQPKNMILSYVSDKTVMSQSLKGDDK